MGSYFLIIPSNGGGRHLFFCSFALTLVFFPNTQVLFVVLGDVNGVSQNSILIAVPFRLKSGLTLLRWVLLSVALALLYSVGKYTPETCLDLSNKNSRFSLPSTYP